MIQVAWILMHYLKSSALIITRCDSNPFQAASQKFCCQLEMGTLVLRLDHFSQKLYIFFVTSHNFFPLSSVQIIIIPACCLLCVL